MWGGEGRWNMKGVGWGGEGRWNMKGVGWGGEGRWNMKVLRGICTVHMYFGRSCDLGMEAGGSTFQHVHVLQYWPWLVGWLHIQNV